MGTAIFKSTIAEIIETQSEDFKHPLLTLAKFVLIDDKGNSNNQGVKVEDFEDIIQTAIDTPVKMLYAEAGEKGPRGHFGSIPIGHIKTIEKDVTEDGTNRLIATAMLYSEEFPEEVTYLKESHAAGKAPGISYELLYKDSVLDSGVEWLKKITTKAATFVKSPAYGSRTALLALASNKELSAEDLVLNVAELVHGWEDKSRNQSTDKGGNKDMELEEKVKTLEIETETLKADAATKQSEIERLTNLVDEKEQEISNLNTQISEYRKNELVSSRERKYIEAGFSLESDAEKLAKKREFWASLSEDAFDEYLSDLASVKATATPSGSATASRKDSMPKLAVAGGESMTLEELKQSVRNR